MNILFLDIDGVLNACDGSGLNTDKVALLKEISDATDCRIVLSSTWRLNDRQLGRVVDMLHSIGSDLWSVTPDLVEKYQALYMATARWREIMRWIDDNSTSPLPGHYRLIILDDEADMGPLSRLHVRTDSHTGLTQELAREVMRRFNG